MLEILVSSLSQPEKGQGEAALEFSLALFTQRLKLSREDREELTNRLRPVYEDKQGQMYLLLKRLLRLVDPQDQPTAGNF